MLILRCGTAWFIFVWAVNKILAPVQYQKLAKWYDKVDLDLTQVYIIAGLQIVLCLIVFVGWARLYSYGALAAMHGFTVYRELSRYLDPFAISDKGFPVNRGAAVSLCAFAAMLALWLLRRHDHWSLDALLKRRSPSAPGMTSHKGPPNMIKRLNYIEINGKAINGLASANKHLASIDGKLRALVEVRVSQINGCVYCVDTHATQARDAGETQQRLDCLAVWQECQFFDDRERAALAWAEAVTLPPGPTRPTRSTTA